MQRAQAFGGSSPFASVLWSNDVRPCRPRGWQGRFRCGLQAESSSAGCGCGRLRPGTRQRPPRDRVNQWGDVAAGLHGPRAWPEDLLALRLGHADRVESDWKQVPQLLESAVSPTVITRLGPPPQRPLPFRSPARLETTDRSSSPVCPRPTCPLRLDWAAVSRRLNAVKLAGDHWIFPGGSEVIVPVRGAEGESCRRALYMATMLECEGDPRCSDQHG